ncbi:MAG: septum formation initiator [Actinobacteria bacterium BACL15 MAG-120823-bin78]|jgi:cell division protein FtsB|uniref:Septum formation initiator n=1 Tax=Actinobacteria bacterium BACL15 MAG-120823-bin78 TaxID=1655563 RepID=A0A0R2PFZ2_9ACTN|nr:MAG: septum formation initiator [Actinobacteria bacterium BACL15 MAG-120823-bin78]
MARRQLRFGRRRTSNRVLALSAIFFVLALTIAPPVKNYFTQRAQISALKSQLSADNSALEKARQELTLWQDPEYIKSQARERLHFVLPGERQYLVTEGETLPGEEGTTKIASSLADGQPWYARLIASISETGN